SSSAPESTTSSAPQAGESAQNGELSPQDFSSLEDYAKALIEKKQSTASTPQSETADSDATAPDLKEIELSEAQPQETNEESQPRAAVPHDLDLEGEDFLSTKALNDKINANATLKQVLEADQPLRNAMFRNARLASEAAGYKEVFPDLDSARYAANQAIAFADLDHAFMRGDSRQGAEQFFGKWAQMAMLTDENGNVVRDQNGNPRMHGAWNAVNQHIFDSQLDFVRKNAERTGDHELVAALDVLRESVSPSSRATDGLPPHLRAAADSINRREQELLRQQFAQQERDALAFDESVGEEASDKINALVQPVLEKAALSDFVRQTAQEKIENAIVESLNNNRFFQSRLAELTRLPANEETRQQRLNLIMTHVQAVAGPIVRQVLREASQPVIRAQEDRRAKIESQIARTRSEPKSVGGAALPGGGTQTPEQLLATAREQLRGELGDEPSMQQVIERFARLRQTASV
ncbi:MAG TPA: hypothetical protein VKD65_06440, partial [Candidatus Angelobacter sp.]|nr:hypothetical protein [Candidatus Angelobacter sp.]